MTPEQPEAEPDQSDVDRMTQLLRSLAPAAPDALAQWMREAQTDLRRVAHAERLALRAGETLSTTALVHEAYLRFAQSGSRFVDRKHFFATSARAMRQILVDYSRVQRAQKRGAGALHEDLDSVQELPDTNAFGVDLLILDAALTELEKAMPRAAQVVQLRFFVGLDDREIGQLVGVEESTVRRDWLKARGWLYLHLGGEPS